MASTGALTINAANDAGMIGSFGTVGWNNANRIASADDSKADAVTTASGERISTGLKAQFASPSLREDATVTAVIVAVERSAKTADTTKDFLVRIHDGSNFLGSNLAVTDRAWGTTDAVRTYLFTTNLPSVAQVNSGTFGVILQAKTTTSGSASAGPYVDSITITDVQYTYPGEVIAGMGFDDDVCDLSDGTL